MGADLLHLISRAILFLSFCLFRATLLREEILYVLLLRCQAVWKVTSGVLFFSLSRCMYEYGFAEWIAESWWCQTDQTQNCNILPSFHSQRTTLTVNRIHLLNKTSNNWKTIKWSKKERKMNVCEWQRLIWRRDDLFLSNKPLLQMKRFHERFPI